MGVQVRYTREGDFLEKLVDCGQWGGMKGQ